MPVGCSLHTFGIKYILMKNCCILEIESNITDNTSQLKVTGHLDGLVNKLPTLSCPAYDCLKCSLTTYT